MLMKIFQKIYKIHKKEVHTNLKIYKHRNMLFNIVKQTNYRQLIKINI
jgi:hypothetical protein